jgi:hypothetical protein
LQNIENPELAEEMSIFSCCCPEIPSSPEPEDFLSERNPAEIGKKTKTGEKQDAETTNDILTIRNSDGMVAPSADAGVKSRVCLLFSMFLALATLLLNGRVDYKQDIVVGSQPSRAYEFADENDHMEIPLEKLNITDEKRQRIELVYRSDMLRDRRIIQLATETGMRITHHLIYRYYASADWGPSFYGKRYSFKDYIFQSVYLLVVQCLL